LLNGLLFLAGAAGLILGAELLVRGASRLALALGISPLVVGLTIVAFGTSAPEMAVSAGAVLLGTTDMALGNVVGSNIFNVLFILGVASIITPLSVHLQIIRQEAPVMIGGGVLLLVLSLDGRLGLFDSALLFGLLLLYTAFLIRQTRVVPQDDGDYALELRSTAGARWDDRRWMQVLMIIAGLGVLVVASHALVTSAVVFAKILGASDLIIGLTIVAAGTSLPEVAASVMAALKGERDIAVGNVVGSCVFNVFGVLGLSGLVAIFSGAGELPVPEGVRDFDLWVMLAAAVAAIPVFLTGRVIARWEGCLFVLYYGAYTAYLVLAAQRHDGLAAFSDVMLGFVLPLTIVTLVVAMVRRKP
jgi:cation:H+ antiporter